MAQIQKVIITDYPDGSRVMSNIRNKKGVPVFKENDTYTATRVTTWYDGTPMDDSKADGKVYLKHTSSGDYYRVNLPNDGELFLEKDTVAQLRGMSSVEILLLRMGYYKGLTLNGYYTKRDTPASIQYYLSDTTESDDGGSVFEVGGVKLEHDFNSKIDVRYYGITEEEESSSKLQYLIDKVSESRGELVLAPNKNYKVRNTLVINTGYLILNGNNSSLIKVELDNNLINVETSKNKIYNVTFIGRYHQQNGDLCLLGNENLVDGCNFSGGSSSGVLIEGSHGNIVTNNHFEGKAYGVKCRESFGNIITNNYFTGGYRVGIPNSNMSGWEEVPLGDGVKLTTGVLSYGGERTIISNNVFDKIYRDALDTYTHGEDILFTNNIVSDLQTFGIDAKVIITDSTEDVNLMPKTGKLIISNNLFKNVGIMSDSYAVSILNSDLRSNPEPLDSNNGVKYVIISNNIIEGGSRGGIVVDSCSDIDIIGNTIKGVPHRLINLLGSVLKRINVESNSLTLGVGTATGITVSSANSQNCTIKNNNLNGIGDSISYGVSVAGSDHLISGNKIDNCRAGVICVSTSKVFLTSNHITNLTQAAFTVTTSTMDGISKMVISNNYVNNVRRVLFTNSNVDGIVFTNNTAHDYETFIQGESKNFQESNNIILI